MEPVESLVEAARGAPDPAARQRAFSALVARFHDMAAGAARRVLGDAQLAEDAAQEAFLAVWRHLPALRDPAAFPAWCRRIAVSQAHRILRVRRGEAPLEALTGYPSATADPAAEAELGEARRDVAAALRGLPEAQRAAVLLYYMDGRSVAEVAAALRVPATTVKNRLHLARRRLRRDGLGAGAPPRAARRVPAARARLFPLRADPGYLEARARGLLAVQRAGLPQALRVIRRWHPRLGDRGAAGPFTLEDARMVVARQHGFPAWEALVAHLGDPGPEGSPDPGTAAARAIEDGDLGRLRAQLRAAPALVAARGTNGNSLLHLAAGCRNLGAATLLLRHGADPDLPNDRGATPLHQAAYANQVELAAALLDAGAGVGACGYGDGGTPLAWALFWGHAEAADLLARRAVVPANLRVAAGLGRLDLLRELSPAPGRLHAEAGRGRAFHRPHTGFPEWHPSADPQEILDEALGYAARNGRAPALAFLLSRGAALDSEPYRGTALCWAANCGRTGTVAWLLDHGADPNRRGGWGGPGHGEGVTALQIAAGAGHLAVVRLLLARGADAAVRDALHGASPAEWAEHGGHPEVAGRLRAPRPAVEA